MKIVLVSCFAFLLFSSISSAQVKILFDATKAETAGNADWVIDADLHNLIINSGSVVTGGSGNQSNPARYPTPAQSSITSTTAETYWEGGLSYMGIDCVKQGYEVETLPYNGQITYGNTSNAEDLSNYKVFVVCEPNILFTSAEKTAILNFVQNGGGLFMISDHTGSDRNNDGHDSPQIWNNLKDTNTVAVNPFGITFDYANFSQTSTNVTTSPTNPIINGSFGNVTQVKWSNGTTMTLSTAANSTVKGYIWKSGASQNNSNVMMATAKYGAGKVAGIGDSSPFDDGTGDPGDQLYDGYITDAAGNHRKLIMNTIIWLATSSTGIESNDEASSGFRVFPQPASDVVNVAFKRTSDGRTSWKLYDVNGKIVWQRNTTTDDQEFQITAAGFASGMYSLVCSNQEDSKAAHVLIMH